MHVDEVRRYYEQNTRRFLTLGQGGAEGAIHRAVWGEGVKDRREAFHFVHELVLREAKALPSPLRALDLGCGVGACLVYLAERLAIEGLGITLSPLQVELARRRVAVHPTASSIEFREGDFENLPPMDAVDLATAIESFIHGADPNRFMGEVAKVLRPGGRLVVCDDFLSDKALTAGATERALLEEFTTGWHAGTLETVAAVDQVAQRHGLELISDTDLSPHLELGRLRDRALAAWVRLGKWAGPKNKYIQAMVGGNALQRCLRSGLVQYRFVVWSATGHTPPFIADSGDHDVVVHVVTDIPDLPGPLAASGFAPGWELPWAPAASEEFRIEAFYSFLVSLLATEDEAALDYSPRGIAVSGLPTQ